MHIPVLLNETIEGLVLAPHDIVVDGTLGGAGHSEAMLKKEPSIQIVGIDLDEDARDRAEARLSAHTSKNNLHLSIGNFKDVDSIIKKAGFDHVNKILLDLGWSSFQLEGRGFSFMKDEPLLMTMQKDAKNATFTAETIVNEWEENNIADVIYGYGEETHSRRIARGIVEAREALQKQGKRISTTTELADIISRSVPFWYRKGKIHPATRTFQALRIAVNSELTNLENFLEKAPSLVASHGRIAIISFHSLEDRIVKRAFKALAENGEEKALAGDKKGNWALVTKKPIIPTEEEIRANPRSRSAKLRIIERIA